MTRPSFITVWRSDFEKYRKSYADLAASDPFDDWDSIERTENAAEDELLDALRVLYGEPDSDIAVGLLRKSEAMCGRALSELQPSEESSVTQRSLGQLWRCSSHARYLLTGALDLQGVVTAANRYVDSWGHSTAVTDQSEACLAAGVRLLTIANGRRSAEVLSKTSSVRWHKNEFDLLSRIAVSEASDVPALHRDVLSFFDTVRNPRFEPQCFTETGIIRFEWGVIVARLIYGSGRIRDVIEAIRQ